MSPTDARRAATAAPRHDPEPTVEPNAGSNAVGRPQIGQPEKAHTATTTDLACSQALRDAAGPGYVGEWALFCDYATATDQPALPTTVAALTGFLAALPARPATVARRIRAIAAAHRRAGHLLTRPPPAPPPLTAKSTRSRRPDDPTPG